MTKLFAFMTSLWKKNQTYLLCCDFLFRKTDNHEDIRAIRRMPEMNNNLYKYISKNVPVRYTIHRYYYI